MSRFGNLRKGLGQPQPDDAAAIRRHGESTATPIQANRKGKVVISGYFSPEMRMAVKVACAKRGINQQEAMIEALDQWLLANGEHPVGG